MITGKTFIMHFSQEFLQGQDRTAAERNYVAEATSRRRRILQAGFFLAQLK